jgi:hypothetical protein
MALRGVYRTPAGVEDRTAWSVFCIGGPSTSSECTRAARATGTYLPGVAARLFAGPRCGSSIQGLGPGAAGATIDAASCGDLHVASKLARSRRWASRCDRLEVKGLGELRPAVADLAGARAHMAGDPNPSNGGCWGGEPE